MSEKSETFIACLRKGGVGSKGFRYLKITVPVEIVRIMGLKHGDYLRVKITKIELKEEERWVKVLAARSAQLSLFDASKVSLKQYQ